MALVKVLRRVRHDNQRFVEGDVIEMSEKQAQQLVDSGEATFDTEGDSPSKGKTVAKKDSSVKKALLGGTASTRKSVSEKAQDRENAKTAAAGGSTPEGEPDGSDTTPPAELPQSFTTPEGEFSVKTNKNGVVSGYQFVPVDAAEGDKPATLKKVDYQNAFEATQEPAGEGDSPSE